MHQEALLRLLGKHACSLDIQVNSYLNFLPAGYGGSKHHGGASIVAARQALDTLEQVRTRSSPAHRARCNMGDISALALTVESWTDAAQAIGQDSAANSTSAAALQHLQQLRVSVC